MHPIELPPSASLRKKRNGNHHSCHARASSSLTPSYTPTECQRSKELSRLSSLTSQLTNEETQAQRRKAIRVTQRTNGNTCSKSHSKLMAISRLEPRSLYFGLLQLPTLLSGRCSHLPGCWSIFLCSAAEPFHVGRNSPTLERPVSSFHHMKFLSWHFS